MFRYYNVWLVDSEGRKVKHIDTVKCLSAESAAKQCYMNYGSASKYTGWGYNNFLAEEA